MGKKFFVVPWIFALLCGAPGVFSAESDVRKSASNVLKLNLILEQDGLSLTTLASGTPIGKGVVVTNQHLFENDAALRKAGFDLMRPISQKIVGCRPAETRELWFSLKVKKINKENDIIILQADLLGVREALQVAAWNSPQHRDLSALYALLVKGIPIATKEPVIGDAVYFAGFPGGGDLRIGEGVCRCNVANILTYNGNGECGMSGGAVLDRSGAAVGFIAAKLHNEDGDWVKGPSVDTVRNLK